MDTPKSVDNLRDFESRISRITDPAQERFARELIRGVVENCPLDVLTQIATCIIGIRRAELVRASTEN